jgi:hypothetical protein
MLNAERHQLRLVEPLAARTVAINGRPYFLGRRLSLRTGKEVFLAEGPDGPVLVKTHQRMEVLASRRAPSGVAPRIIESDNRYIVREFLQGHDLNKLIGSLDAASRLVLVYRLTEQVRRLHASGVVHGDLRAWNVWIEPGLASVQLINFDWSLVDGEGHCAEHHGPERSRPEEIDLEGLDALVQFIRAGVRQPRHETAWRAPSGEGDLARVVFDRRMAVVQALSSYAGIPQVGGLPMSICYVRESGADDLLEIGDRAGCGPGGGWSGAGEGPEACVRLYEEPGQLPSAPADLAIVALGSIDDLTAYERAVRKAAGVGCGCALFVLAAEGNRNRCLSALRQAVRRVAGSRALDVGRFSASADEPDFALVFFDVAHSAVGSARLLMAA